MCSGVSEGPFTCVLPISKLRMTIFFCFGLGRLQKTRILLLDFLNILQKKRRILCIFYLTMAAILWTRQKKKVEIGFFFIFLIDTFE